MITFKNMLSTLNGNAIIIFIMDFRISRAYMTVTEIRIDETPLDMCFVNELSRGIVQLSSLMSTDLDYAVTVTVHGRSLERTFTQIASITETGPTLTIKYIKIYLLKFVNYKWYNFNSSTAMHLCILFHSCSLNCNEKVAVSSKLALVAWCQSCVPEDDVIYDWHVWENLNGTYKRLLNSTEEHGIVHFKSLISFRSLRL